MSEVLRYGMEYLWGPKNDEGLSLPSGGATEGAVCQKSWGRREFRA